MIEYLDKRTVEAYRGKVGRVEVTSDDTGGARPFTVTYWFDGLPHRTVPCEDYDLARAVFDGLCDDMNVNVGPIRARWALERGAAAFEAVGVIHIDDDEQGSDEQ